MDQPPPPEMPAAPTAQLDLERPNQGQATLAAVVGLVAAALAIRGWFSGLQRSTEDDFETAYAIGSAAGGAGVPAILAAIVWGVRRPRRLDVFLKAYLVIGLAVLVLGALSQQT